MNKFRVSKPSAPRGESYANLTELAADKRKNGRLYHDQNGVTYLYVLGFTAPTPLVRFSELDAPIMLGSENIDRNIAWPLTPALPGTVLTIEQD